jgi:hypothetical protein
MKICSVPRVKRNMLCESKIYYQVNFLKDTGILEVFWTIIPLSKNQVYFSWTLSPPPCNNNIVVFSWTPSPTHPMYGFPTQPETPADCSCRGKHVRKSSISCKKDYYTSIGWFLMNEIRTKKTPMIILIKLYRLICNKILMIFLYKFWNICCLMNGYRRRSTRKEFLVDE